MSLSAIVQSIKAGEIEDAEVIAKSMGDGPIAARATELVAAARLRAADAALSAALAPPEAEPVPEAGPFAGVAADAYLSVGDEASAEGLLMVGGEHRVGSVFGELAAPPPGARAAGSPNSPEETTEKEVPDAAA
jgi:hypothetical protein